MKKILFRIRRRLVNWLLPSPLTVFLYAGLENGDFTTIYDEATKEVWACVKVERADRVRVTVREILYDTDNQP